MVRENISIVASGDTWLASGAARPIESALMENIKGANKTIEMTMAYSYKARAFADNIWNALEDAASKGVKVYLIINEFDNQDDYERVNELIKDMKRRHPHHFKAVSFNSEEGILHAKIIVIDRNIAIISSSNHSDAGYSKNHEMGVLVSEPNIAATVSDMFRELLRSKNCVEI